MCFFPVKCQRRLSSSPTTPLNSEKRSERGRPLGGKSSLACQTAWMSPLSYSNDSLTRVSAEPRGCGKVPRHRAARRVSAEVSPESEEESFCCLHSSTHAVNVEHQERSRKELRGVRCVSWMFVNRLCSVHFNFTSPKNDFISHKPFFFPPASFSLIKVRKQDALKAFLHTIYQKMNQSCTVHGGHRRFHHRNTTRKLKISKSQMNPRWKGVCGGSVRFCC